jgi:small subunit ribosomal protein S9
MAIKMSKKRTKIKKIVKKSISDQAEKKQKAKVISSEFKIPNKKYIESKGGRKVASARVRIYEGQGDFVVNNKLAGDYFRAVANASVLYLQPFEITGTKDKFAVTAKVSGSGYKSQLGALVHGLSRALIEFNPDFKPLLKHAGLLTRDDRMKETRKIGMGGKARRKRQSPKR